MEAPTTDANQQSSTSSTPTSTFTSEEKNGEMPPPPRVSVSSKTDTSAMPPPPKRPRLRVAKAVSKGGGDEEKVYKAGTALLEDSFEWNAWCQCPRFSRPVQGTRFISLKTPLSTCYEVNMKVKDTFTVDMFVERFSLEKSKEPVCLVANAVWNSDKFYYNDHNVYDEWDISLLNLPAQHDNEPSSSSSSSSSSSPSSATKSLEHLTAPSGEQVDRFIKAVREKWSEDPLQLIGVVSLYGYDRSGVLIVAFLVEELKLALGRALKRFADARPPGIYSKSCLEFLAKRYASSILTEVHCPPWDKRAMTMQPQPKMPGAKASEDKGKEKGMSGKPVHLPKPWVKAFSKRMNREYFFNPVTKKSVWSIDKVQ